MPSLRTLPHDLHMLAKYHLKRRVADYPAPETELGVVSLGFHGVPEITLESSWRQHDPDARVRPHIDLVRAVTRELAR